MKNKIFAIIGIILFSLAACTKDFEEVNTNPNSPETAPLTNILAYNIQGLASRFGTTELFYPAAFAGYVGKGMYNNVNRYSEMPSSGHWSYMFTNMLTNLDFIIESAETEGNNNIKAAAMVLKAYTLQMLVDTYGPIPFSESGQAEEGNVYPAYDSEKDVYTGILSLLKEANALFDVNGNILGTGDLLYNDDISKWKKFCNSLRLRVAIRVSNVDEALATTHISEIFGDAATYPVFETNHDNAKLEYPGGEWIEPWYGAQNSIPDLRIGKPLMDKLLELNDPRIAHYAQQNDDGIYKGLPIGADTEGNESMVGTSFMFNPTGSVPFLKYTEVLFIKAEAAKRGLASGLNAEEAYNAAVTASLNELDIEQGDIDTYLANTDVEWNDNLDRLYTQKWIALFRQSWEAWAEVRRTDVPQVPIAVSPAYTGHNRVPFRFPYPIEEKNLNGKNIPAEVTEQDGFWGYQIWWDTRSGVN